MNPLVMKELHEKLSVRHSASSVSALAQTPKAETASGKFTCCYRPFT